MTLSILIQQFGYAALFIGTFLEGETILVLAGFAAHRGYLSFDAVIAVAATASFLGDQAYFQLGRRFGPRLTARYPSILRARARLDGLLAGREFALAFLVRFLYGLRVAGPIAIGMSRISAPRFAAANLAGAAVWAGLFSTLGYYAGQTFEALLGRAAHYEALAAAFILGAGCAAWITSRRRARRKRT